MNALPFCLAFTLPISVVVGYWFGGFGTFLTPFVFFVILPMVDLLGDTDKTNPSAEELTRLSKRIDFRIITILSAFTQLALVTWGGYVITSTALSTIELIGITFSIGVANGGVGNAVAHELIHKRNLFEKNLGKALLMTVCYMHYYIEHRIGHHANVATPIDASTACLGESIYMFYPRTVSKSFLSAWSIESARLKGKHLPVCSYHNQMIWFMVLPIAFGSLLAVSCGWQSIPYFFIQSIIGFSILEITNYVEHYGLKRNEISPGYFEKVSSVHAWEANLRISNYFFFKLQRHADHHLHADRRYHILQHYHESPQLPSGYAGMGLLALVPPLWRRVMDPRVHALQQGTL
jgi:alkane 1-monooxygenase